MPDTLVVELTVYTAGVSHAKEVSVMSLSATMSNIMPPLALLGCAGHVSVVPGMDEPPAMTVPLANGLPAQPSGMPLVTTAAVAGLVVYEMLPCHGRMLPQFAWFTVVGWLA